MMTALDEMEQAIAEAARSIGPAVVGVGPGSGVALDGGRILTNAHNLRGEQTAVRLPGGEQVTARLAGADLTGDVAVLTVDADLDGARWADDPPALGATVFGAAAPHGALRVTLGFVSATDAAFRGPRGRLVRGVVEHTAPLPRGSSGGPLVDRSGRLLGINTHRRGEGFYLAVPTGAELRGRVDALARGETPSRPTLGIAIAPPAVARRLRGAVGLDDREGLLVREVDPQGAAGHAGVRRGDLLVAAGGRTLRGGDDLLDVLESLGAGEALELRVVRGAEERTIRVALSGAVREEGEA